MNDISEKLSGLLNEVNAFYRKIRDDLDRLQYKATVLHGEADIAPWEHAKVDMLCGELYCLRNAVSMTQEAGKDRQAIKAIETLIGLYNTLQLKAEGF